MGHIKLNSTLYFLLEKRLKNTQKNLNSLLHNIKLIYSLIKVCIALTLILLSHQSFCYSIDFDQLKKLETKFKATAYVTLISIYAKTLGT